MDTTEDMDLDLDLDQEQGSAAYLNDASNQVDDQFRDLEEEDVHLARSTAADKRTTKATAEQEEDREEEEEEEEEDPNQDWEWVEETDYIVLDFGGANISTQDMIRITKEGYSLVGMDTENPYFRAGGYVYRGFFDENAITDDLVFRIKSQDRAGSEDGIDDGVDDEVEALDLHTIVTKRVIFEKIDMLPPNSGLATSRKPAEPEEGDGEGDGNEEDTEEKRRERFESSEFISVHKAAAEAAMGPGRARASAGPSAV